MARDDILGGPAYWLAHYGISTLDEFRAATEKFLPTIAPFGNFGANEGLTEAAYLSPYSAAGVYLAGALTAEGFTGPQRASADAINQILFAALLQGSQGTAMGQLVVPGCFQVNIQMSAGGRLLENVIGLENAAGTAAGAASAVLTAWEQSGGPLDFLPSDVTMVNYHAVDIGSTSGAIADQASTTAGGIAIAGIGVRSTCALVRWNGATRNRSSRGRLYFGPIPDNTVDADGATLDTTAHTNYENAFTAFRGSLSFLGYPLVVLSRVQSQAFLVTSQAVESTIATQRRRVRS